MDRFDATRSVLPGAVATARRSTTVTSEWSASVLWMLLTDLSPYADWTPSLTSVDGIVEPHERVDLTTRDGARYRFRVGRVEHYGGFSLYGAGIRRDVSTRVLADSSIRVSVRDHWWRIRRPAVLAVWPAQSILDRLADDGLGASAHEIGSARHSG
ncbi:hypothetical protein [Leifsonia sp. 21MFCrub1.1]|uniref:hypothetical protein n=1 Tax=Leifsonia sp. 21MFCrub1.1 TaxID=1798223 RepID=UPI0008927EDE|nr:hypothetical protein [Leifsonia sp. 21MFCrub1.1]SEA35679.1 hypothetical protein SAMN04515680_0118 [Leifsonia sp. 21MFCrub1.1]